MRNKEFREVQVSSSGLVFIFLAILVLGVFIFLLGVNVGKKQAQMAGPATILERPATEAVAKEPPTVLEDRGGTAETRTGTTPGAAAKPGTGEPSTRETTAPEVKEAPKPAVPRTETARSAPAPAPGSYYIQVGAFNERSQADAFAARFKSQGYPATVLDAFPTDRRATYRVRLVGYRTKEAATLVLDKLNAASTKRTGYYIRREE